MANDVKEIELNQFVEVAMQIILHAGDARNLSSDALDALLNDDAEKADELLTQANKEIVEAHKLQTDLLQSEMKYEFTGKASQVPLIFIHAQDTVMTIMTEFNMIKKMVAMYKKLNK